MCCLLILAWCLYSSSSENLEGERDYGQQTLATCTFLSSQFRRGVVHMVLVRVKVQGVKSMCFQQKSEKLFMWLREHISTHHIYHNVLHFIVWRWPRSCVFKVVVWPSRNNEMHILRFRCHAQMCLRWTYKAHFIFQAFRESQIRDAYQGLSDICTLSIQNRSTFISMSIRIVLPLQSQSATIYESAARIQIRLYFI